MARYLRRSRGSAHLVGSLALAICVAGAASGCKTLSPTAQTTGAVDASITPRNEAEWRREADAVSELYRANPRDADVAIRYAQALRAIGQRSQAAAVLEQAAIHNPKNSALLGAYGKALADAGNYEQALDVLSRAHTPDQPDWRILSVQGAVLDQLGQHDEARRYYASALRIAPDEPSVLSNLGLSYALSKDLKQAETILQKASATRASDPRVRQNLALVVGLQGRFEEAERIARADLPSDQAAANVTYLRQMLAQQNNWKTPGQPTEPRQNKKNGTAQTGRATGRNAIAQASVDPLFE
ncbi:MAG TPA: tetratricopeptide repeat protein [Xanthobacteraceae bacterium]|nr:tetratricopeptide repeat protein [Xanthobacteraceae bacterium]